MSGFDASFRAVTGAGALRAGMSKGKYFETSHGHMNALDAVNEVIRSVPNRREVGEIEFFDKGGRTLHGKEGSNYTFPGLRMPANYKMKSVDFGVTIVSANGTLFNLSGSANFQRGRWTAGGELDTTR